VTAITEDTLRTLTGFETGGEPVTTCYLDVDGRRLLTQRDIEQELDGVLRTARGRANGTASVHTDLDRIEGFVKGGFDRSRVRGLALFSCAARDLFEVVPLPVRVRSRVVVNEQPAVAQLEAIAEESRRYGVLLVDRQRARMFVFELDELVEHTEQPAGETGRDYDTRGSSERGDVAGHVDALASAHARNAAALAFEVFQANGYDHLVVGASEDLVGDVEGALHAYLRERLVGRINVTPQTPLDAIQKAVVACEEATERAREAALVRRLLDTVGSGGRAVTGLGPVLTALNEKRVEHLIVSHEFEAEGWRCQATGLLHDVRPNRSGDDEPGLRPVQDVVEEAIDDALAQGAKVEICVGNADLDVHGRIGALLRY
jgi:peptide chain release factor subunit 1